MFATRFTRFATSSFRRQMEVSGAGKTSPRKAADYALGGLATLCVSYPIFFHEAPHTQTRKELGIRDY